VYKRQGFTLAPPLTCSKNTFGAFLTSLRYAESYVAKVIILRLAKLYAEPENANN
jgi:hypothetical protein